MSQPRRGPSKAPSLVAIVLFAIVAACGSQKKDEPKETCTKAGDSCLYAPGKIGICVEGVDKPGLLCQSQH